MKTTFKNGCNVRCINILPLGDNKIAPPLVDQRVYKVLNILEDTDHDHIDVGLASKVEFVRCFETGNELWAGDRIHWCHPSRFELVA